MLNRSESHCARVRVRTWNVCFSRQLCCFSSERPWSAWPGQPRALPANPRAALGWKERSVFVSLFSAWVIDLGTLLLCWRRGPLRGESGRPWGACCSPSVCLAVAVTVCCGFSWDGTLDAALSLQVLLLCVGCFREKAQLPVNCPHALKYWAASLALPMTR